MQSILELQPKLLRAVKKKEIERLGGGRYLSDARIIAATDQDLWQMVYERKFRADFYYYWLNVFPIRLPPLRDRREDIPLLVAHFVEKFSKQQGKTIDAIPEDKWLRGYRSRYRLPLRNSAILTLAERFS